MTHTHLGSPTTQPERKNLAALGASRPAFGIFLFSLPTGKPEDLGSNPLGTQTIALACLPVTAHTHTPLSGAVLLFTVPASWADLSVCSVPVAPRSQKIPTPIGIPTTNWYSFVDAAREKHQHLLEWPEDLSALL